MTDNRTTWPSGRSAVSGRVVAMEARVVELERKLEALLQEKQMSGTTAAVTNRVMMYRAIGTVVVAGVTALVTWLCTVYPWLSPMGAITTAGVGTLVGKLVGRPMEAVTSAALSAMTPDKVVQVTANALRSMPPAVADNTTRQLLRSIPPAAANRIAIEIIREPEEALLERASTEPPPPPSPPKEPGI